MVAAVIGFGSAEAADISGAGATFPYPIYAKWADTYKKETGNGLNYQSIGSGGGIKQIQARTVTFGASDAPLKPEQLEKDGLVQFPTVMGGVVPVVNLPGIKPGEITLDGQTLADIYQGKITSWDDAAIKKLNPDVNLPSTAIAVVHRSDGSGTSFIFTTYLSQVSKSWGDDVGAATAVEWPTGLGAKGNEGVSAGVTQTVGSIGYVEYAYAAQNNMTFTKLINKDGQTVSPEVPNFMAAAESADWANTPGYYIILTNEPGAKSWPITAATFILIPKQPKDDADAAEALKFFSWAYAKGDAAAAELHYIPMPDAVVENIKATWAKDIKGADGKPLYVEAK
ncbi:phosphate ABC transporter substrate-binding protein PstS [Mesorhizobium sp. BR1-1-16]|uniref:phosphate ABC transporter substrate-binding protein PstS n=1 Tax=Mesorhizobium sp. BR1-1-16 TaxID=2876653 RepID=UPI001CD00D2F|nr:phosphate ABC transporter substrate-binding protein PstS [Mesorhizobium sp. BR1-1-16]MBZ9936672.1 phosphate ABC transporter substrate-binding protein PstS [Mesorhizobium sp. BR1-1-16]